MDPRDIKALRFRPSLRMRRIRATLALFALTALLVVFYTGYWFAIAATARSRTLDWAVERRARGGEVEISQLRTSGFPFEVRLRAVAVKIGDPGGDTPWSWSSGGAQAVLKPWSPFSVTVIISGSQEVTLTRGSRTQTFSGRAKRIEAVLTLGGEWLDDAALTVEGLDLSSDGGALRLEAGRLRARFPENAGDDNGGNASSPAFELDLDVRGLNLPAASGLPFGGNIKRLGVSGQMLGPIDLIPGRVPSREALASWRDGGGTVTVPRLEAIWGPLNIRASGTMALDDDLQPVGAFTVKFKGFIAGVEALRRRGLIRSRDAVTAKLVLGALSKRDRDGGISLNLPVTVRNRKLFTGPLPLMEIPEISWN